MVDAGIPVVSNQAQYSVFDRRPERTLWITAQSTHLHSLTAHWPVDFLRSAKHGKDI